MKVEYSFLINPFLIAEGGGCILNSEKSRCVRVCSCLLCSVCSWVLCSSGCVLVFFCSCVFVAVCVVFVCVFGLCVRKCSSNACPLHNSRGCVRGLSKVV